MKQKLSAKVMQIGCVILCKQAISEICTLNMVSINNVRSILKKNRPQINKKLYHYQPAIPYD